MKLRVFFDRDWAGVLEKKEQAGEACFVFAYLPAYLQSKSARPVSVNFPLREQPYESKVLFPFFDNLLSEGWLLDIQAQSLKIDKSDRFALVARCGLECMGAVSLRGESDEALP